MKNRQKDCRLEKRANFEWYVPEIHPIHPFYSAIEGAIGVDGVDLLRIIFDNGGFVWRVLIDYPLAYVGDRDSGLEILNITKSRA